MADETDRRLICVACCDWTYFDDLYIDANGDRWDICRACGGREERAARRPRFDLEAYMSGVKLARGTTLVKVQNLRNAFMNLLDAILYTPRHAHKKGTL